MAGEVIIKPRDSQVKRYHWLADVVNVFNLHVGAEVGAATGNTTEYLMKHCQSLCMLYVADDWRPIPNSGQWERKDMEKVFRKKLEKYMRRITILKGLSWEQAQFVGDRTLDFVFIDASHDYESVCRDLQAWIPKVKPNSLICGHDLHFPGVVKALEEHLPKYHEAGVDHVWYYLSYEYDAY